MTELNDSNLKSIKNIFTCLECDKLFVVHLIYNVPNRPVMDILFLYHIVH